MFVSHLKLSKRERGTLKQLGRIHLVWFWRLRSGDWQRVLGVEYRSHLPDSWSGRIRRSLVCMRFIELRAVTVAHSAFTEARLTQRGRAYCDKFALDVLGALHWAELSG